MPFVDERLELAERDGAQTALVVSPESGIDLRNSGQDDEQFCAYLTSQHPDWRDCVVKLIRVVVSGTDHQDAEAELASLTSAARLDMEVEVILSSRPIPELIVDRSSSADLVLLGLAEFSVLDFDTYLEKNDEMLAKLPPTLLVLSNGDVDLLA